MYSANSAFMAARRLDAEIEEEAARIIEQNGTALWDAMEQARKIVQRRRREASGIKTFADLVEDAKEQPNGN